MASASAVQFVQRLRELCRARHEPVRDVADCPQVYWLGELPSEVHVETEAGPGDLLFSIPVIPLTPPSALEDFDSWLALRRWYRTLHSLATDRSRHEEDGYELVLATGLLTVPEAGVRAHLLTTPVQAVFDPLTERADVILSGGPPTLNDRELLDGFAAYRTERTDWVREAVHAGQGYGLQDSVVDVLRKWSSYAFPEPIGFREDWTDETGGTVPRVRLAPALILRPRGRRGLMDQLDGLLAELESGGPIPAALADYVTGNGMAPSRRLAYLPGRTPKVVADLVAALLARGRRVLVATPSPATTGELLAALPAELAPLCVTPSRRDDCEAAVAARAADHDPIRHELHLAGLHQRLTTLHTVAEDLRRQIRTVRAQEIYDLAPGYQGTTAELTALLAEDAARCDWMPLAEGLRLPETPPLTAAEAAELLRLLAGRTPQRAARLSQLLPEPSALPVAAAVRELVDNERTAREQATGLPMPELSAALTRCSPELLRRLMSSAAAVASAIGELGLPPDPTRWDQRRDWAVGAVRDGFARRTGAWDHISELAAKAAEVDRSARFVGARQVVLPPVPEGLSGLTAARHLHDRIATLRPLRDHLATGASMRRGPLRPAVQKAAEPALDGVTVDDDPPGDMHQLDLVIAAMEGRAAVHELVGAWSIAGVSFPADRPLAESAAGFGAVYARLSQVRTAMLAVAESLSLLYSAGLRVSLGSPEEWRAYAASLSAVRLRLAADRATASLAAVEEVLRREIRKGQPPPELHEALEAVRRRDVTAYGKVVDALARAHGERLVEAQCAELYDRLAAAHPTLASLMAARPSSAEWAERLRHWDEAWAWARASAAFQERPRPAVEVHYEQELAGTEAQEALLAAELTAEQAWGTALRAGSPPAWMAPLWQIPGFAAGSFDAVIVDQGATADEEALYLLAYAPRLILTGPPEHGPFRAALEERLGEASALQTGQ